MELDLQPIQQQDAPSGLDLQPIGGAAPEALPPAKGLSPDAPESGSALSILERAAFGWAGGPEKQASWLKKEFGEDNVKILPGESGSGAFVVKGKDNVWRKADPSEWSDVPGEIMQFLGDKGVQSAGAMAGGAKGAAIGSAAGPIGSLAGLLIGGALGAGAAGTAEAGVKSAVGAAGAPQNFDELKSQLGASMLFGVEQELGGKILGAGLKGGIKLFNGALKRVTGETTQGILARSKFLETFGGLKPATARAYAEAPMKMPALQEMAYKDSLENTNIIGNKMKTAVEDFYKDSITARHIIGEAYEGIAKTEKNLVYDPATSKLPKALELFQQKGYLDGTGKIAQKNIDRIGAYTDGNNRAALQEIEHIFDVVKNKIKKGGKLTYDDLANAEKKVDLFRFEREITDPALKNLLGETKAAIKSTMDEQLRVSYPKDWAAKMDLDAKYGAVKEMMYDLNNVAKPQRVDMFLKKVMRGDGSRNAELMNGLEELFKNHSIDLANPTSDILRMRAAQESVNWMMPGAGRTFGIPGSPKISTAIVQGGAKAEGAVRQFGKGLVDNKLGNTLAPHLKTMATSFKNMPPEALQAFIKDPRTGDAFSSLLSGSLMEEDAATQDLLKGAQ